MLRLILAVLLAVSGLLLYEVLSRVVHQPAWVPGPAPSASGAQYNKGYVHLSMTMCHKDDYVND